MFIDRVKIRLVAGKGGNGVVAWRREKYIPKGGPCGGNGGPGGSVIFKADPQIFSLEWFHHRKIIRGENGGDGGGNRRQGKKGKDLIIKVPCGTLIKDLSTDAVLYDLTDEGEEWVACRGGKGGRGNDSFKTPTNRAPNICTPGKPGEVAELELELKMIADVGLMGFPNAGKSTLISRLSKARAKIAPYPFTTLHPNIGYIEAEDFRRIHIADIPGIIENAHQNRGLGIEFLRHIERTKLLIFVIDVSGFEGRMPEDDYRILRKELEAYEPELLNRPHLVVLNKIDMDESEQSIASFLEAWPLPSERVFPISALTGEGLDALRKAIADTV